MHMIIILVSQEIIGKVLVRITIVKWDYTMNSNTMYPKHDPSKLNANNFVNPKVVSWYTNFLGA